MKHLKQALIVLVFMVLTVSVQATVVSYTKNKDGITCALDKGLMNVKICFDNMIEVKYTTLPVFLDKPSLVITNDWKITPGFTVAENASEIVISTAKLKVVVNRQTNAVKYTDLAGNTILAEDNS